MTKFIKNLFYVSVFFYICMIAFYFGMQRSFLYMPPPPPYPALQEIEERNPSFPKGLFQEVSYAAEDGVILKGWYAPPAPRGGRAAATIVYFHGNADTLSSAVSVALPYVEEGYGFFLAEYRGYGGLGGKPTQDGLFADGRAAMMKAFDMGGSIDDMIVMGHSLGTGVAAQAAVEFQAPRLILIAPFFSALEVARGRYPLLPVAMLMLDRYENNEVLGRYRGSVLIAHGDRDVVIPIAHAQRLFALAREPKRLHAITGSGHSELFAAAAPLVIGWLEEEE